MSTLGQKQVFTLEQNTVIDPSSSFWVPASAGTGKTQVLTARVLRLLLEEQVKPENILCVTFTKAAAAEMAQRIFNTLASWVSMPEAELLEELHGRLGVHRSREKLDLARTLFATVLDARGGLKIQTLHSFCQSLLTRFPLEAGMTPSFSVLEERTDSALHLQALDSEIVRAFTQHDQAFLKDITFLAQHNHDKSLQKTLRKMTAALAEADPQAQIRQDSFAPRVRSLLGLPIEGDAQSWLDRQIASGALDMSSLRHIAEVWGQGKKTLSELSASLAAWLAQPKVENIARLKNAFLTREGKPRAESRLSDAQALTIDPAICATATAAQKAVITLAEKITLFQVAEKTAAALRLSWAVLQTITATKNALGLVSFHDLIAKVADLLNSGAGEWVRYRLDDKITHILVDEAQDTNADQWSILSALSEEFFVGKSAQEKNRSLFVVGDYKQSIFRFQGADPQTFISGQAAFAQRAMDGAAEFHTISLSKSFRSAPAIIDFVNAAITQLGADQLGEGATFEPHTAHRDKAGGDVILWPLLPHEKSSHDEGDLLAELDRPWEDKTERRTAARIARQIKAWLSPDSPHRVRGRPVMPSDILVLVQKRGLIAAALINDLKALGVPVAGADRMILSQQLAVQDLLSAMKFALQPEDDLNLACLLKSPIFDFSEEKLFAVAHGRQRQSLWSALRDQPDQQATVNKLKELLALADAATPFAFLSQLLEKGVRARLIARLGADADEPVAMLLDEALTFEQNATPSMQAFVSWMAEDDRELKRDPDAPRNDVRVLTVHGAKGLQAKIVILADSNRTQELEEQIVIMDSGSDALPVLFGNKDMRIGPVDAAYSAEKTNVQRDYWRLFYVAITRAEDQLYFAGWEPGKKSSPLSWYNMAEQTFATLHTDTRKETSWGDVRIYTQPRTLADEPAAAPRAPAPVVLPVWARTPAPAEPVPPRPLAPSQLGGEASLAADPPMASSRDARTRGMVLHRLLELLPQVPVARRAAVGQRLLQQSGVPQDAQAGLYAEALAVLEDPAFAAVFSPESLAEVPITAVLGKFVLSGQIDRLVVTETDIRVVDYKTSLNPPARLEDVPPAYLRQMAAYTLALKQIYPAQPVRAALLWTAVPQLMPLPDELLAEIMASFADK